ncbi:DNA repair protein RecN [Sphingobacterium alkalisoli]|uniref:DNA repair protein RecN n=1 Tax=Sphingobacterium alkalisoli TaxID=1874115 RepID=A0A4U0GQN5_9SPHI|nr:DNA repair protein RecN [Sphingobacterium alkalisoli]TJY60714.1 DNA repair protein RecN [Sphingobacterium alkalisoli]GGH31508.1 DNA repair protein RecN [Sphingobacterium alkalisoli]
MLTRLFIKNYALIDNLDISFDNGLNIITGETGAGKSIIMGALGLILGNRVEGKQFFDESQKCIIEGYFGVSSYALHDFFEEMDLDYENQTIIRREIAVDGKSRAFVNDSPVTLNVLKALGERLIDIHSQHATLQLNTEEFQLFVVDSVAANDKLLQSYRSEYKRLKNYEQRLQALKQDIHAANAELDYNQFLFDELEKVNLIEGEVAQLEAEQQQLENAEDIKKGLSAAQYALIEGESNIQTLLKDAVLQLQNISKFFKPAEELAARLQSAYIEIKDISNEVELANEGINLDADRLDHVNARLSEIYTLLKKHRLDTDAELLALQEQLERKLQLASSQDEALVVLENEVKAQLDAVLQLAHQISGSRQQSLPIIQENVNNMLVAVGMPNANLQIDLEQQAVDKLSPKGLDKVQFLFSANKGQALQPIHKVASGGELSRVMLAIKSLVSQRSALPTIIFDEIDTGISGEVALRVGEVMENLAQQMQVLAITHLPQIASKGTAHFKVYKQDLDDRTKSNIRLLDPDERILEVAQMLSGSNPGDAALQHAKELLG